jgi:hypothetical protein
MFSAVSVGYRAGDRQSHCNIQHLGSTVLLIAARGRLTVCLLSFLQALLVALREFLACVSKPKKITCGSFHRNDMLVIKLIAASAAVIRGMSILASESRCATNLSLYRRIFFVKPPKSDSVISRLTKHGYVEKVTAKPLTAFR